MWEGEGANYVNQDDKYYRSRWQSAVALQITLIKSLKNIYFYYIHNYVNYCNIAWACTSRTKLDNILKKQKHAVRIIYNKDKFTHSKPLMRDMNALNVYQINIFQALKSFIIYI